MSTPHDEPGPIRIEVVDLESPVAELSVDDRYAAAWVIARRGGVPQAIVEIDLSEGAPSTAAQLAPVLSQPDALPVGEPDLVPDQELPRISVVVPSIIARTDELQRCLAGFARIDYPDFEILIVDNRREVPAADALPGLVANHPHVRVVRARRPGISAARNAGVAAADGEIIVFTDDDVQVDAGWLRAFGQRFTAAPELQAITGLILPAELETPAQVWFERYYGGFSGERTFAPLTLSTGRGLLGRARVVVRDLAGAPVRSFALYGVGAYGAGANMAFRRSVLQNLGGFDLALGTGTPARGGEDLATLIDVLWQGGAVGYEPGSVVFHQHRRGYDELLHQLSGNGIGFTAMLTSLIVHDPRHLAALAAQLPLAAQRMVGQSWARLRGRKVSREPDSEQSVPLYPSALVRHELLGLPRGPFAYVRSRRAARAWVRANPTSAAASAARPARLAAR